ncbi:MAG: hypothetical protein GY885_14485, partial [Phycisphaeraceae bacterium]|nr:hypothetical protein [Phycisphaeraceae bacterium]
VQRINLVELVAQAPARGAEGYVVRCGELSVEVGEDFDEDTLVRLLRGERSAKAGSIGV